MSSLSAMEIRDMHQLIGQKAQELECLTLKSATELLGVGIFFLKLFVLVVLTAERHYQQ